MNVHTRHCCLHHGCKYGDEDCPVALDRQLQEGPCEWCREDSEESLRTGLSLVQMVVGALEGVARTEPTQPSLPNSVAPRAGLVLPGWTCDNASCGVFNGEVKAPREECRACGRPR